MAAELIIAPEAEQDLAEAYAWYEGRRSGLGEEFLSCVDACVEAICRGASFDEASTVFGDPLATTVEDTEHSGGEERFLTTGLSSRHRVVIVWHTEREDTIRIVGAREATPRERRVYESGE